MLSWQVGAVKVTRVVEMEMPVAYSPDTVFLKEATPAELRKLPWLYPNFVNEQDELLLSIHALLVEAPGLRLVVDTCVGNDKPRDRPHWNMKTGDKYMQSLAAAGFTVNDIDYVMCTHLHVDHVGWNTKLENGRWVPTFPKARYVFGKQEFDYWAEQNSKAPTAVFKDSVLPITDAKRADLVGNEHQLNDYVRLLPTPGHTPGHVAVCVGRKDDDAVFTGDLLHSPLQARYPQYCAKVDFDKAQSEATRRSFLERYCDTKTLCCTAHFPSPSVGRIKRWGDGFKCEPVAG